MERDRKHEDPKARALKLIKRCGADFLITKSDDAVKAATALHTYLNTVVSSKNDSNWSLGFEAPNAFVPVGNTIPGSVFKEEKTIIGRSVDFPTTPKAMMDILELFLKEGKLPSIQSNKGGESRRANANYDSGKYGNRESYTGRAKTESSDHVRQNILKTLASLGFGSVYFIDDINRAEKMGVFKKSEILAWPEVKANTKQKILKTLSSLGFASTYFIEDVNMAVKIGIFTKSEILAWPEVTLSVKKRVLKTLSSLGFKSSYFIDDINRAEAIGIFRRSEILNWPEVKASTKYSILRTLTSLGFSSSYFTDDVKMAIKLGIFTKDEILAWPEVAKLRK